MPFIRLKDGRRWRSPNGPRSRSLGSENGRGKHLSWRVIGIALSLQAGALAFSREAPGGAGGPLTAVQSNGDDSKPPAAARRTRNEELAGESGSRNQLVQATVPTRLRDAAGASGTRAAGNRSYFALLVGCTDYQLSGIPELWGPNNDVPEWAKLLVSPIRVPRRQCGDEPGGLAGRCGEAADLRQH